MKYVSGVKKSLWYLESKKTAKYLLKDMNKEDIIKIAIEDNLYQVENQNRAKTIGNTCITRLNSLPKIIIEDILNTDINTSKILVLISVMKTNRLFFEFMHEVFRNKIILGNLKISNKDLNLFFDEKIMQSETIANWKESTIKRLKGEYIKLLSDAGVITIEEDLRKITLPWIDFKVEEDLKNNKLNSFLYAITGEK